MRKVKYCLIAIIVSGALYTAVVDNISEAADASIGSKGNFILEDGEKVAFYSSDVSYLQHEIEKLFNEIK